VIKPSPAVTPDASLTSATPSPSAPVEVSTDPCEVVERDGGPALDVEFPAPSYATLYGTVVAARQLDGTGVSVPDTGEASLQSLGSILGGTQTTGTISTGDDGPHVVDVVGLATLVIDGETERRALPIRVDGRTVAVAFPDLDATGTVTITFEYSDACHRFTSTATATVQIGSVATVAGCPTTEHARHDYLGRAADEHQARVGETVVPSYVEGGEWPWLGGNFASDSGTLFGAWDRTAPPIHAEAGERLVFSVDGDSGLTGFLTRFYTRSDAVHEFERLIKPVVMREPKVREDGTVFLELPDEPGSYVTFTSFGWATPCLSAGSIANFEVDVQ
jgi:hypothetical protein